jgi:hypothetical protein
MSLHIAYDSGSLAFGGEWTHRNPLTAAQPTGTGPMTRLTTKLVAKGTLGILGALVCAASIAALAYHYVYQAEMEHLYQERHYVTICMVLLGIVLWLEAAAYAAASLLVDTQSAFRRRQGIRARREARARLELLLQGPDVAGRHLTLVSAGVCRGRVK